MFNKLLIRPAISGGGMLLGGSSQDLQVVHNHGDRKSPRPLRNGRTPWLINGGDPITTYIHQLGAHLPSREPLPRLSCRHEAPGENHRFA